MNAGSLNPSKPSVADRRLAFYNSPSLDVRVNLPHDAASLRTQLHLVLRSWGRSEFNLFCDLNSHRNLLWTENSVDKSSWVQTLVTCEQKKGVANSLRVIRIKQPIGSGIAEKSCKLNLWIENAAICDLKFGAQSNCMIVAIGGGACLSQFGVGAAVFVTPTFSPSLSANPWILLSALLVVELDLCLSISWLRLRFGCGARVVGLILACDGILHVFDAFWDNYHRVQKRHMYESGQNFP